MPYIVKIMSKLILPPLPNPLVVALAYDGLCTFEFGIAVEVFGLARPELGPNWYRFAVAGVDDGPMRAAGGVMVSAEHGLEHLESAGTIIVPGWRGVEEPVPAKLVAALRAAHARGARILSFCSGVFVLAAAGLLSGKRATTHWRYAEVLGRRHPDIEVVPDVLYVDAGSVLTSAGTAAGLDLCLHLIRRDFGAEAANVVARRLVVPAHRDGGQAQFIQRAVPREHEGGRLAPIFERMRARLGDDHAVATLARLAGMSRSTFLRRFEEATGTTPSRWLIGERLTRARELLESSTATIEEIADVSGFGSTATLRHHFRAQLGTSPAAYRTAFAASPRQERLTSGPSVPAGP